MEIVEIKIRKNNIPKLKKLLEELDFLESYKITEEEVDLVSIVAEKSLAEEWNSDEDSRWDEIL